MMAAREFVTMGGGGNWRGRGRASMAEHTRSCAVEFAGN